MVEIEQVKDLTKPIPREEWADTFYIDKDGKSTDREMHDENDADESEMKDYFAWLKKTREERQKR